MLSFHHHNFFFIAYLAWPDTNRTLWHFHDSRIDRQSFPNSKWVDRRRPTQSDTESKMRRRHFPVPKTGSAIRCPDPPTWQCMTSGIRDRCPSCRVQPLPPALWSYFGPARKLSFLTCLHSKKNKIK